MTAPLVDPNLAAFQDADPNQVPDGSPVLPAPYEGLDARRVEEVAIALGAAFLVMHRIMSKDLQAERPQLHDSKAFIKGFWRRRAPIWAQLTVPAIKKGYELGQISGLTQDELEAMAQSYAEDLGEYVNDTSADALVVGFQEQLGAKWSEQLAWHRAAAAFGLDTNQMRSYVRSSINSTTEDPTFELLPQKAQVFIEKALTTRAERLAGHEAWQSMEMGKALAWMAQKNAGKLPVDAQKEWLTAADEHVCPQCGPLNRKRVFLDEQFQTPDGNKYWSPGVHPNCRCDIKLIYPEITNAPFQMVEKAEQGDPFDRDRRGRFSRVESRGAEVLEQDPFLDDLMQQVAEVKEDVSEETAKIPNPYEKLKAIANPYKRTEAVANPYAKPVANPYEKQKTVANPYKPDKVENPYKQKKKLRRRILVIMPNGEEVDHTWEPLHMWASDHHDAEGFGDQQVSDSMLAQRGQPINFEYPDPNTTAWGRPWRHKYDILLEDASALYSDRGNEVPGRQGEAPWIASWDSPHGQELANLYDDAYQDFKGQATENLGANLARLSPNEMQHILENAGHFSASQKSNEAIHQALIDGIQRGGEVQGAYLNYMEEYHPYNFAGARDMQNIEERAQEAGLTMHVPQIFIIEDPNNGAVEMLDDTYGTQAVRGQYRVRNVVYRSADSMQKSITRPANIKGINFVYLENEDYQESDPNPSDFDLEWDSDNIAHNRAWENDRLDDEAEERLYGPDDDRWSS